MKPLAIAFILCYIAFGHDLWISKEDSYYVLYYGHIHPSEGESGFINYNPQNVQSFKCFNYQGNIEAANFEKTYPAKLKGEDCAVVYALLNTGYWSKTVSGIKHLPKSKLSGAIESWQSYESVKNIYRWSSKFKEPLTDDLEIAPAENPFKAKVGDKITLIVYYRGRPVKDAVVAYKDTVIGRTDENGRINVRLRHKGTQVIRASVRWKADDAGADFIVRATTLVFNLR